MSTASVTVVLSQQPYTFRGLVAIGKIFFILALVLLICFIAAISYRFIQNPSKLHKSLHRPGEALYFGSFWVSLSLILICIQQYGVPASGPWLIKALEILFWIYAACALIVAIFQYSTLFVKEHVSVSSVMPTWIFPVYPFLIVGPLASVLIPSQPPQAALNIFIGGVFFEGTGWCISLLMYTIYLFRLMSSELPPPPSRPGMLVSVGPAAYTSAGLTSLGLRARTAIPPNFLGIADFNVGAVLQVIGVFAGIFVWLFAFWFLAITMVTLMKDVRKMSFTLSWWALIFPNAGLTLATIQIGNALNSSAIKAVASAMTILLVIAWFFVAGAHIWAVATKNILWEGMDADVETDK